MTVFDSQQPLNSVHFALFDLETTGLVPAYGHRVCEVACLRVCDGVELGRFESLVDPGRSISPGAFRVNQITPEMLSGAPTFETVAPSLGDLMGDAVLVAHNAPFDLGFLAMELEIAGAPPPEGPVVDTLTLVRRVRNLPSNNLAAVASAFNVEIMPTHRAMGDVLTTLGVLECILWDLDRRWGVCTLGQLLDFQGGSIPYPPPQIVPLPPTIAEALESRGHVRMRYVDARGQETDRIVQPLRVREQGGLLYLVAHCFQRDDLRTFRLDRVIELVLEE
jgi:DNA polymerase-3 subunit epsilon